MSLKSKRAGPAWLVRSQAFNELRRSFLLHVRRPILLVVVIAGALVQFAVTHSDAGRTPGPAVLSTTFAPPPLDSFSWFSSGAGRESLATLLLVRVLVLWLFVCLVLGIRPRLDNLLRTSSVYILSVAVFAVLLLGLVLLAPMLAAVLGGVLAGPAESASFLARARLAMGTVYLFAFIPSLILATVAVSPLPARAAARQSLRPRLNQLHVWLLVILAALLHLPKALAGQTAPAMPGRATGEAAFTSAAFLEAFLILSLQSLLYAAIVHSTSGSAVEKLKAS